MTMLTFLERGQAGTRLSPYLFLHTCLSSHTLLNLSKALTAPWLRITELVVPPYSTSLNQDFFYNLNTLSLADMK